MKVNRKIIEIDEERCDGCGQCVPACAEGALKIIDGKARVVADVLCDGLGACLGECPTGALKIVEREAEEFDEAVVEKHLAAQSGRPPGGCPSAEIFPLQGCETASRPASLPDGESNLANWPVQIRLVPPTAPFLKNADLLVLADCTAVVLPRLHRDLLEGRVVLMGCPKFDDAAAYVERFAGIFRCSGIRSVTVVTMEVPCCEGLPHIVRKGMTAAANRLPLRHIVASRRGEVISDAIIGPGGAPDARGPFRRTEAAQP